MDTASRWGERTPKHEPALLEGFRPRPTDVLITTAPKCGTTWMQQILHQVRTGGEPTVAPIAEVVPWLEDPSPTETIAQQLARYEALPDPRVFKTHLTASQTPGLDTVRIVMTSRDPRDACVSMFHHKRDLTEAERARSRHVAPASMAAHVDQWLAFGAWYRNVRSWWPERARPNLLWLRYEDLVDDLPAAVDRISAFLGLPLTPGQRERVVAHASFAWMRRNEELFTRPRGDGPAQFVPGGFIRRGRVERGRELSTEQAEAILARARAELEPDCLAFLGLT